MRVVSSSILDCNTNSDSGCLTGHFKEAEDDHLWIIGVFIGVVVVVGMLCGVWRKKKGDNRTTSLNVIQQQDESNDSQNDAELIDGNILRPLVYFGNCLHFTKNTCVFYCTLLNRYHVFFENSWTSEIGKPVSKAS